MLQVFSGIHRLVAGSRSSRGFILRGAGGRAHGSHGGMFSPSLGGAQARPLRAPRVPHYRRLQCRLGRGAPRRPRMHEARPLPSRLEPGFGYPRACSACGDVEQPLRLRRRRPLKAVRQRGGLARWCAAWGRDCVERVRGLSLVESTPCD